MNAVQPVVKYSHRNRRVFSVAKGGWSEKRLDFFKRNIRYSASAKSTRTVLQVTQEEVAKYFGVTNGTVCNWESGKYSWPDGEKELFEYMTICRQIANA
jgi:DNA-binding XRE family transcriptional regulator